VPADLPRSHARCSGRASDGRKPRRARMPSASPGGAEGRLSRGGFAAATRSMSRAVRRLAMATAERDGGTSTRASHHRAQLSPTLRLSASRRNNMPIRLAMSRCGGCDRSSRPWEGPCQRMTVDGRRARPRPLSWPSPPAPGQTTPPTNGAASCGVRVVAPTSRGAAGSALTAPATSKPVRCYATLFTQSIYERASCLVA
jgi:hypothetical protein